MQKGSYISVRQKRAFVTQKCLSISLKPSASVETQADCVSKVGNAWRLRLSHCISPKRTAVSTNDTRSCFEGNSPWQCLYPRSDECISARQMPICNVLWGLWSTRNAPETTDMAKSCAVECLASGYDRFGRAGVVSGKRCTLGWKSGPLDTTGFAGPAMFEAKGCTFAGNDWSLGMAGLAWPAVFEAKGCTFG